MSKQVSVLFVCLGNICRSPTAHAVFRNKVADSGLSESVRIDSAGTGHWHVGKPADRRASQVAASKGIEMADLRARQVDLGDLIAFDYVLAMDEANFQDLKAMALPEHHAKIHRFLDFAPQYEETQVPDPYYGGADGFEWVFELVEAASDGLIAQIEQDLAKT